MNSKNALLLTYSTRIWLSSVEYLKMQNPQKTTPLYNCSFCPREIHVFFLFPSMCANSTAVLLPLILFSVTSSLHWFSQLIDLSLTSPYFVYLTWFLFQTRKWSIKSHHETKWIIENIIDSLTFVQITKWTCSSFFICEMNLLKIIREPDIIQFKNSFTFLTWTDRPQISLN